MLCEGGWGWVMHCDWGDVWWVDWGLMICNSVMSVDVGEGDVGWGDVKWGELV